MFEVVKAFITNDADQFLVGRRPCDKIFPDLWELPGGKVEGRENHESALEREILEELGSNSKVGKQICYLKLENKFCPEETIHFQLFHCEVLKVKNSKVHDEIRYINESDTEKYRWVPADYLLLQAKLQA